VLLVIRRVGREGISGCNRRCDGFYYVDVSMLCLEMEDIHSFASFDCDDGHTKFLALPSRRSSAVGGMVGWRIGRSRPSDE